MSVLSVISIIDDDPSVRLATNNLLTSRGYTVCIFGSALEFLQSAELKTTSCVIADVQMSVMGGVDLLMHMRGLGHRTPFIFMTAFPDDAVRDRALKAGAICFLAKPFSTPALINCLEKALSKHSEAKT
ncbi:FixJ family two-component response regulator [Bradyrhizobium japonicum]|uniref:Chemotaxis protein CheY n=1 Tax=Bradyrhizobium japonicum TaxID=375 RepID=A0A0A3XLJ7_BRAJP|nr:MULTISPECIES: response regulator [Bradyrhizobium]KGT74016.1 chemotaxis protein CheY [Bradyrhizobium japonicum]MBR0879873.1 response regulator [Bradyrhizobium liaoningense]MBR0942004.1 response regulator [Bradyrhizobium liaoningense]MBR0999819.1 response regulator [Bradyrhizobium liaoningense]MBR1031766.1 response regulator [Bradyrhizobium liaoningense]